MSDDLLAAAHMIDVRSHRWDYADTKKNVMASPSLVANVIQYLCRLS